MFEKVFSSLGGNFKRRTTNPFLGTLVVVWIIRNWEFVYALFYFDDFYTLLDRLEFISDYFQNYGFSDVLITILISFCVIIITNILLNVSLLIANYFEKKVKPFVLKLTDKNSVVAFEDYQALQNELEETREQADEEKNKRLELRAEVEDLELRNVELQKKNTQKNDINSATDEKKDSGKNHAKRIVDILYRRGKVSEFQHIATEILNGSPISKSVGREFAGLELVKPHPDMKIDDIEERRYQLTDLGKEVNSILLDH